MMDEMTVGKRVLLSVFIAFVSGFFCYNILKATASKGDFYLSAQLARDLVHGVELYSRPTGPDTVPYPLTAALLALPLSFLPDPLASGVFMALICGLLTWLIVNSDKPWRWIVLTSWPFVYSLFFGQWTPLVMCLWFTPLVLPVLLVKPQISLPLVLTTKPGWRGIVLTVALGVLSLVVAPKWPWIWLSQLSGYKGILPPFFALPLGPLMLLAMIRWRRREAWLLLLMSLMPQRVVYDQLALLLVASNWRDLTFLSVISWFSLPALLYFGGWLSLPGGWQLWILAIHYIPALLVVLRSKGNDELA
jgi:hypothetical protein